MIAVKRKIEKFVRRFEERLCVQFPGEVEPDSFVDDYVQIHTLIITCFISKFEVGDGL